MPGRQAGEFRWKDWWKHKMLRPDEAEFLRRLAKELLPDPIIVNIGSSFGSSTWAFLEARPDAVVFSVDMKPCPEEMAHVAEAGGDPTRVIRLLGLSQEVGLHFPPMVDLLFIDGDHSYAGVLGDIDAWVDKVKPGGAIAFHDYRPYVSYDPTNVIEAVDRRMGDYEVIDRVEAVIAFRQGKAE